MLASSVVASLILESNSVIFFSVQKTEFFPGVCLIILVRKR